uniref:Bm7688 n=1 Tax=Brugia malayi TaxID=6279 RepID=A0A1I9FZH7_BRUMA|nr:Bm7688 [Brugia malayi]
MKKGSNEKIVQDHAVRTRSSFCLNRYHLKTDDLDEINGPSDNVDFDETHRAEQ